jgi:hypothetical protein
MSPPKKSAELKKLLRGIDKQIRFNQGKNIFMNTPEVFQFTKETLRAIANIDELNIDSEEVLADYATDKAIEEFCRVNQYYSFDLQSKMDLRNIYSGLFKEIRTRKVSTENISRSHYEKIRLWLKASNPFAEKIYGNTEEEITPVACSEYSPELQINILHIDFANLIQPVLDIGCGSRGLFVNYLRERGIEAYGIDRFRFSTPGFQTCDWLEFDYGIDKWGTIISHLGFSNHFYHHNLREDGNYIGYGKTYMAILFSLKKGGCFHYTPDLPFIEHYLDNKKFALEKHEITGYDILTSIIKRLT